MASGDANVFPPKNTAFRLYGIHFRDNTGALVTSWTGAASSISIDGAAASSGGTPTEIGTTGMGYLDLTSGDMNGEAISVKCTVTNASANGFVSAIYTGGVAEIVSGLTADSTFMSTVATAVWAAGTRTLTSFGTLVADIWSYVTRTLTAITPFGGTVPSWDGTEPTTYEELFAFLRVLSYYKQTASGVAITYYQGNTAVATAQYIPSDTSYYKSEPVQS